MPPDVQARIFERFESNTLGTRHRGVGLGLSIVRSFVELHGGRIELVSAPGQGTTVTCIFPSERHETPSDGRSGQKRVTTARRRVNSTAARSATTANRLDLMHAQDSSLSGWTILLDDHAATERFARVLVDELRAGDLVTLSGGLGAGKTTLARALIRLLADDPDLEVPSPTFTLMQTYEGAAGAIVHADFYRLGGGQELVELGWDDATETAITLVEWPERADDALKAERLHIELEFAPGARRPRPRCHAHRFGRFRRRACGVCGPSSGLVDKSGWADAARAPMPSDASVIRSYERLVKPSGETAL